MLNIKLFNVRMRAKNVVITFVATARFGWLSRDFLTAFIPSAFGRPVYNIYVYTYIYIIYIHNNVVTNIFCGLPVILFIAKRAYHTARH